MNKKSHKIPAVFAALILGVTAIACLLAAILIPAMTRKSIETQEAALPESAISAYLQSLQNQDIEELYQTSLLVSPHYNTLEDYRSHLQALFEQIDLDQIQIAPVQQKENQWEYDLVSDGKWITTLTLAPINGQWKAATNFQEGTDYRIEVPEGISFTVNGFAIRAEDCIEQATAASNFSGLNDLSSAPEVDHYLLSNLLSEPELQFNQSDIGFIQDALSNTLYVGKITTDSELKARFIQAAKALAQYPTRDGSLSAITSMTVTGSDFYNRIKTMDNQWYAAHNSAVFKNMTVHRMIQQSEDTVLGNISFDYTISASSASRTYHCGYQLTLLQVGSSWKIAGIAIDNEMK